MNDIFNYIFKINNSNHMTNKQNFLNNNKNLKSFNKCQLNSQCE